MSASSDGGGLPRPLEELPVEAARAIRGLLFDVDDTVTRDSRLEVRALEALERLGAAGILRVAITGRPLGWAEAIAHQWPVDLAIGENGAGFVRVTSAAVRTGYFLPEHEREEARARLSAVAARARAEVPEIPLTADHASRRFDLAFDVGERAHPPAEAIARLEAIIAAEGLRVTRSSIHLHAVPGSWDKAVGALWAVEEALGEAPDAEAWAFVGDSGNDAAAFARFPVSVGVANVRAHLPALPVPPRYITRGERGEGFAELAATLLSARGVSPEGPRSPE